MTERWYIDFETRSEADLKKVGIWKYSTHPSTEILCVGLKVENLETSILAPYEAFCAPLTAEFHAHNALFEYCIWNNVGVRLYGWPKVSLESWHCSAALAAYHSLPRSLDGACSALKLPTQKNLKGHRLMLKMSKPRKPTKNNQAKWHEDPVDLERLAEYCKQDVEAEYALVQALGELPRAERELWLITQEINLRGVGVDMDTVAAALKAIAKAEIAAKNQIQYYSSGQIKTPGQVTRILDFCRGRGVVIPSCSADIIDDVLRQQPEADPTAREVLRIRRESSKSSLKKYQALANRTDDEARLRDLLLYYGASTGRWAGMGFQIQNLKRCSFEPGDLDHIHQLIQDGNTEGLRIMYGSELDVFSQALRSTLKAPPRRTLIGADYASIEARVLLWLAEDPGLRVFQTGDIYVDMASAIYRRPVEYIDKTQRQVGKVAVLGLGYGMGAERFQRTCYDWTGIIISDELATEIVDTYRTKYYQVKEFWNEVEHGMVKLAIKHPGQVVTRKSKRAPLAAVVKGDFLTIQLPSGRRLFYREPRLVPGLTPWGSEIEKITYMSVDGFTRKWVRTETWGGKLVENITQAVARDIMAAAMKRLNDQRIDVVLSIHDELIVEVDEADAWDVRDAFKEALIRVPGWATGLPIAIDDPWINERYVK
jgi:DNA polymerase